VFSSLQLSFSQSKVNFRLADQYELDKLDYEDFGFSKVKFIQNDIYYLVKGEHIKVYRKGLNDTTSVLIQTLDNLPSRKPFLTDFSLDSKYIYFLYNDGIRKSLRKDAEVSFSDLKFSVILEHTLHNIAIRNDKIIVYDCYNHFVDSEGGVPKAYLRIYDTNDSLLFKKNFDHDAFSLTHLANSFFSLNENFIAFSQGLRNSIEVIDLNSFSSEFVGNSTLLNDTIDKMPFQTTITQSYNYAKKIIYETKQFTKEHDYIEGVLFIGKDSLIVIKKLKSDKVNDKRLIDLYTRVNQGWSYRGVWKYKNGFYSRKNHIFQFYLDGYVNTQDPNYLYFSEVNLPNSLNSKIDLLLFMRKLGSGNTQNYKALYVFKPVFN
jgi:hypothetical protein